MDELSAKALVEILCDEHALICELLARVYASDAERPARRAAIERLCEGILAHLLSEDRVLYPRLLGPTGTQEASETAHLFLSELLELRALVTALQQRCRDGEDLDEGLVEVECLLERRLNAEERVLFPLLVRLEQV